MKTQITLVAFAMAAATVASPIYEHIHHVENTTLPEFTTTSYPQSAYQIPGFPIHTSCDRIERRQLEKALGDTILLAQTAAQHIYLHGNESTFFTKYFGTAPTAEVIGWYEKIVYSSREGLLFRCDDPDGNCHQEGWGGHWRGENATLETVICPLSYTTRQPLETFCGNGYTVAAGKLNYYFASDLLHRLYHVSSIGEGVVGHIAETYEECLALAEKEPSLAVRNTHTLQYFALDVFAYDVVLPNEGCTDTPANSTAKTSTPTTSAAKECHTHADGDVHCE